MWVGWFDPEKVLLALSALNTLHHWVAFLTVPLQPFDGGLHTSDDLAAFA